MVEVTEADRIAAAAYMKLVGSQRWSQEGILSGGCDNTSIVQAFATHREAAAKAERDRLRDLPDDAVAKAAKTGYVDEYSVKMIATALTDALESQP